MSARPRFAVIVLAAGASSRLGRPKQLEVVDGEALAVRAARAAAQSGAVEVIVVVEPGPEGVALLARMDDAVGAPLRGVENRDAARGVGTSIRAGIAAVRADVDAAIVMVCDQVAVTSAHLTQLAERLAEGDVVAVGSAYAGAVGVPVAFARPLFGELTALGDAEAGKVVLARHAARVTSVPLEAGELDVDTEADLAAARARGAA